MTTPDSWLEKFATLRVDRASGNPAPHKPLLLLAVLDLAERGELPPKTLPLSPELAFRFYTYWTVVAHRRKQRPDVRLPFYHLQSDGVWSVLDKNEQPAMQRQTAAFAEMSADFVKCVLDPTWRARARSILIAKYFRPEERLALYSMLGLPIPSDDQIAEDAADEPLADAAKKGARHDSGSL